MVQSVVVQVSPKQMSKMRNGHKVRVKPPMEGSGVNLIVHPENYNLLARAFKKGKGAEIVLTPPEIVANKELAPQMQGNGIFGKKFDRAVKKVVGSTAQKAIYSGAKQLLPVAQSALTAGLTAGATALGGLQPELIPFLIPATAGLSALGSDYLANPSKYQSKKNLSSLAQEYAKTQGLEQLNKQLGGTNMGYMQSAGYGSALANAMGADMSNEVVSRNRIGSGLYASSLSGGAILSQISKVKRITGGQVGLNGGFVQPAHQAMASQPNDVNFQFQATLPPQYQRFTRGNGLGAGFGAGLYV